MTLTTQQKLEAITARICEVVPGVGRLYCQCGSRPAYKGSSQCINRDCKVQSITKLVGVRNITLEDVLLFLHGISENNYGIISFSCTSSGMIRKFDDAGYCDFRKDQVQWKLGKHIYEQDSITIDWLYSLLSSSK